MAFEQIRELFSNFKAHHKTADWIESLIEEFVSELEEPVMRELKDMIMEVDDLKQKIAALEREP